MSDSASSCIPKSWNKNSATGGDGNHLGKYIKLNVGNCLFLTSYDTLTKEDTMFKAMFSGRMEVVQDSEGKEFSFQSKLFAGFLF
jgi:BTB/POZ domain-containing adapter for CUL3-mediated RhoA degradation protein